MMTLLLEFFSGLFVFTFLFMIYSSVHTHMHTYITVCQYYEKYSENSLAFLKEGNRIV